MNLRVVSATFMVVVLGCLACGAADSNDSTKKVEAAQVAGEATVQDSTVTTEVTDACKVIAYYFYGSKRCVTCKKLEAYTKEAIETGFADQLKSGELVWMPVNVDELENEHFRVDYNLYTKSVVLSKRDKGKETEWKNLEQIWQLVRGDKAEYVKYIQDEVTALLGKS